MRRFLATAFLIFGMVTTAFAYFGTPKFDVGEFGVGVFSGQFGEGVGGVEEAAASYALVFDGTGDYVTLDSDINLAGAFAIEITMTYASNTSGFDPIVGGNEELADDAFRMNGNDLQLRLDADSKTASTSAVPIGSESVVRLERNAGGDVTYTIDGVDASPVLNEAGTMTINRIGGNEHIGNDRYFTGQIRDVKIYITGTLTHHWDFSDGAGATLTDIVGGNNGTITNAVWLEL